ncbi:hypothetical protein Q5P01_005767 [Channa striata]|uniref:Uncharacterized protein n=1 Tax=Channa striata TaxID=64152 RepID=A0AA88NH06_CHASR|nr:hypothetical protein Q5P01_005767 [Channa striata]
MLGTYCGARYRLSHGAALSASDTEARRPAVIKRFKCNSVARLLRRCSCHMIWLYTLRREPTAKICIAHLLYVECFSPFQKLNGECLGSRIYLRLVNLFPCFSFRF